MSHLSTHDLYRIFHKIDKNGDGLLGLEELNGLLETLGVWYDLRELEEAVGKPTLDFNDFLYFYQSVSKDGPDGDGGDDEDGGDESSDGVNHDLAKAFQVFDLDGDGFITCEELQSVLSRLGLWDERSGKDCGHMIKVFDTNLDGVLDFEEFKNMMLQA